MPKRIPSKLPQVSGNSGTAQGFRMAFDRINEILEYLESLQPSASMDSLVEHTPSGVTRRPKTKRGTTTGDEAGEARWA